MCFSAAVVTHGCSGAQLRSRLAGHWQPTLTEADTHGGHNQRLLLPLSDTYYQQVCGRQGIRGVLMMLGRAVAAEYRQRHEGEDPPEWERFADGTTRVVKCYPPVDPPWITELVRDSDV